MAYKKYISLTLFMFFLVFARETYAQNPHEIQLIKAINGEENLQKKYSRIMALGLYYKIHNIDRADSIRHVILRESRNFNDSIRFYALMYNADVSLILGNQDEYFKTILACQPFLNSLNIDNVQFKIYRHLGYYHTSLQEFETAAFYLRIAAKIAKKTRKNEELSEAHRYLAFNYMYANDKDSALIFAKKSIQTARKSGNRGSLSMAFNSQAQIYGFFGQVELSVAKNIISLHLAEEAQDVLLLAQYSREVGQAQKLILNFRVAESYFKESLEYAKQIHDTRQIALAMTNLAAIQLNRKEFSKAIDNAEKSIRYLERLNAYNELGETYNILGMVYVEQGKYNLASSNYNQALVYYESTSNKEKIAGVYHNVGTVFKEQKKYTNALNYLNRSIEIRQNYGAKNQIYHTFRIIAEIYKEQKNYSKSLEYMELYLNYLDSNTTLQAATKIAELSESYRAEQRERLITLQADSIKRQIQERDLTSTKLENSQLRNNFQMYIIIAFIIIIVLAIIILFFRWNQTKIKQQQVAAEMSQKLLRSQMNPHFVFNAMSVIQSYIFENDTINSSKFLVNFSRLMRLILENSSKENISITTEIEILNKYLEMQKLRFQDRFTFTIHADDSLYDEFARIPPMITQPFIENAIEHGQLHTIENGFIYVSFKREGDMLKIIIEDNGIGRKGASANKKSSSHKSMAMSITDQRIKHLSKKYKREGSMLVEDYDKVLKTGTKVVISLPYIVDANPEN